MVWQWLRNKLGIEDNTKELLNLNTKVHESIKLLSICISKLEEIEVSLTSIEASTPELKDKIKDLSSQIKAIPKEMLIKNILSI